TQASRPLKVGREAIEQALQKPTPYDFKDKSLSEALNALAEQSGVAIHLDTRSLAAAGSKPDLPITEKSATRTDQLAKALTSILEKRELVWTIHDEILLVTTKRALTEFRYMEIRTYMLLGDSDW